MVDRGGLENRCTERYRGFESLSLRRTPKTKGGQIKTNPVKSRFYGIFCYPFPVAALDRKIQLELAPPTPVSEEQEKKQETESPVHIVQPPDSRQHIQPFKGLKI